MVPVTHIMLNKVMLRLDDGGQIVERAPDYHAPGRIGNKGLEIEFRRDNDQSTHKLFYFSVNLSDTRLPQDRPFLTFLSRLQGATTFLKATSYMIHDPEFSIIRERVLSESAAVLQDDSGVPYHFYLSPNWRVVVMTQRARQMLQEFYQAPPAKIDLIPHGIPDIPLVDPNSYKGQFGVEGKVVLLTFGLLSPNKGIEQVLNALPHILGEFPDVVYVVMGATHPHELQEHGEAYRLSLENLARKNKVEKNVIFYNRFVELEELKEFIGAADLYITPYLNEAQITSGALAYAFGAGKAVVSTPYWHAAELLAEDRGILVPFGDSQAIAREVAGLLRDSARRHAIGKNAYKLGREMVWNNVARLYMSAFEQARLKDALRSRKLFVTKTLDQQQHVAQSYV